MKTEPKNACRVLVRIWKKNVTSSETPILIFPDEIERNYCVQMWEPIGQHGAGDPQSIIMRTRPATAEETADVVRQYENHYDCHLKVIKRLPRIDWTQWLSLKNDKASRL